MHTRPLAALWLFFSSLAWGGAADAEWPDFRGPGGQGHSRADRLPVEWSEQRNIRWKTALPGQGWSSPVVQRGRVWMSTATESGQSLRALAVDAATGRLLHDVELFRVDQPKFKHALNSYASPSPVADGDRVYFHFGTHGTAAVDARNGRLLWRCQELQLEHENGPGSSPALWKNRLIIPCDGTNVQYVAALDTRTGKVAWRVNRSVSLEHRADQMRKAYSTPLLIEVQGRPQAVVCGAEYAYAYDPDTGREIWRCHYPGFSNVPRPVYGGGLLYVATGFTKPEMWAIRPDGQGDVSATHVAWKVLKQAPAKPSPIFHKDRLYMVSDSGIATCLDAKTGREIWQERIRGEFSASPLLAGNRLYCFSQDGPATVLEASDTFRVAAQNSLDDGCMASPAVVGRALFVRTKTSLYRIEE
jgi:outer membrane protein assembly factor BamB